MHIIVASSCSHALNNMTDESRRGLSPHIRTISGLSLNPNSRNILKNVTFVIENSRSLRYRMDLVLWHNTIINTTTKHRSNNFSHCDPDGLVEYLQQDRFSFEAIVYYIPKGALYFVKSLLKSGV